MVTYSSDRSQPQAVADSLPRLRHTLIDTSALVSISPAFFLSQGTGQPAFIRQRSIQVEVYFCRVYFRSAPPQGSDYPSPVGVAAMYRCFYQ